MEDTLPVVVVMVRWVASYLAGRGVYCDEKDFHYGLQRLFCFRVSVERDSFNWIVDLGNLDVPNG